MKPELLKALEADMFDHHEYEALEAEAFLKGQAKAREIVAAENAARELRQADFLRSHGVSEAIISEAFAIK